jgi:dihydroneopterin aldolase
VKNNDIVAFGDLLDRSIANNDKEFLDRISVRDYIIKAEIGAFQSERGNKQRIRISVVLEVELNNNVKSDDVDRIISYDTIIEAINKQLSIERINLLETFAEKIASEVLTDSRTKRVFVRVEKLDRIPGALGVEIVRASKAIGGLQSKQKLQKIAEAASVPSVILIPNSVVNGDNLSLWFDGLEKTKKPVVICVEGATNSSIFSENKLVQRRIDLLEIEKNAWLLAGKDERCVVINSRTELDWAIKSGQLSIWAPSKIVLDAVDKPLSTDAIELANWFSQSISDSNITILGKKVINGHNYIKTIEDLEY